MKKLIVSSALVSLLFCGMAPQAQAANVESAEIEVVAANKWDKILDEYEKFVDQYIKLYKKAMAGDMSALSEYTKILEKAEKLSEQLAEAEDEMTPAQLNRYMKIVNKMAKAAM